MLRTLCFFLAIASIAILPLKAHAEDPTPIGAFGAWQAFTFMEDGQKVCYMASKPTSSEGKYSKRGEIFALITHRPGEGTKNVFSYITGYEYKASADATAEIDGQNFLLFTQNDTAWAPDADTDNAITEAIRKGSKMVVTGTSSRDTLTKDTFSLRGSSAAHKAISDACSI